MRRIQALLGRGACPRRELADQGESDVLAPDVAFIPASAAAKERAAA